MKTNSILHAVGTLLLAPLLTLNVLAGSGPARSSATDEPERIYDPGSKLFIDNPDYHAPAPVPSTRHERRATQPDRVYNLATKNFEFNPYYQEPPPVKRTVRTAKSATDEPERIYDPGSKLFIDNPNYHAPAPMASRR